MRHVSGWRRGGVIEGDGRGGVYEGAVCGEDEVGLEKVEAGGAVGGYTGGEGELGGGEGGGV